MIFPGLFSSVLENASDFASVPANVLEYLKFKMGDESDITEKSLAPSDLKLLRKIAKGNLDKGMMSLGYDDYGIPEDKVLKGGKVMAGLKSFLDPNLRMATLLGKANIEVGKDGNVFITDTYDFNSGPNREKYARLKREGKHKEAEEFLNSIEDSLERESIKVYYEQPKPRKTRINLGKGMFNG